MRQKIKKQFAVTIVAVAIFTAICAAGWFVIAAPYSVTGTHGFGYSSPHVGGLMVVDGRPHVNGKPTLQNWLYVMIICSDVKAAESQSSGAGINHDIMSDPLFHWDWETQTGTAHVSFRWNMWLDTISIGKQKFSRKNGNVFVVVRKPTGELIAKQCGNLGTQADLPEIVQHIRQWNNDSLVASVKFYSVDK